MRLGSVILKVKSTCVANSMWYFPLLQPYVDHIPVKEDLSDLKEKIEWCRKNDAKCKQIAENAKKLYNVFCSREGILDYLEMVMHRIHTRYEVKKVDMNEKQSSSSSTSNIDFNSTTSSINLPPWFQPKTMTLAHSKAAGTLRKNSNMPFGTPDECQCPPCVDKLTKFINANKRQTSNPYFKNNKSR